MLKFLYCLLFFGFLAWGHAPAAVQQTVAKGWHYAPGSFVESASDAAALIEASQGMEPLIVADIFEAQSSSTKTSKNAGFIRFEQGVDLLVSGLHGDSQLLIFRPKNQELKILHSQGSLKRSKVPRDPTTAGPAFTISLKDEKDPFYLILNSLAFSRQGLAIAAPKMIEIPDAESRMFRMRAEQFVVLGMFIMLSLYSFSIFMMRPDDKNALMIGVLALFLFLRYIATERLMYFMEPSPLLRSWSNAIVWFCSNINFLFIAVIMRQMLPQFRRPAFQAFVQIMLGFAALAASLHIFGYSDAGNLVQLPTVIMMTFGAVPIWIAKSWRTGGAAKFAAPGLLFFSLSMVWDFAQVVQAVVDPLWFGHLGMQILAFSFALGNAKLFAQTYEAARLLNIELDRKNSEITAFSRTLEIRVQERTAEIRGLLDNIPQGVLTIEKDGIIGSNQSEHLLEIVPYPLTGKSFKTMIFDYCTLSRDEIDQAWNAILSSLDTDVLNYEVNSSKLPREFQAFGKYLKATFSPRITDNIVHSILVTLLDISAEKAAEAQAAASERELQIILQLISVGEKKFSQLYAASLASLSEVKSILKRANIGEQDIQFLYITAHTIKGGARTLGLKHMAEVIHHVEEVYQNTLRKKIGFNLGLIQVESARIIDIVEEYNSINSEKLGRTNRGLSVTLDAQFAREHLATLDSILSEWGNSTKATSIVDIIKEQKIKLLQLINEQLIIDDYRENAQKIAKDLGKPVPQIEVHAPDIALSDEERNVLDNCAIHILRNIMDHGLESAEERLKKGKKEAGLIQVNVTEKGEFLHITVHDDGRGLNITRLLQRGLESKLLRPDSSLEEIANSIFQSGQSTAEQVTAISGRGVGMSAIKIFLQQKGGDSKVLLGKAHDADYYDFHILLLLPRQRSWSIAS